VPNTWVYTATPAVKGVTMNAYDWKHAWGQHDDDEALTEHAAYQAVSWVRRCVELRCNALSAIPVKYYRGKGTTERTWEYADLMPHLLWMTEAAAQIYGASYWLRLRNPFGFEKGYRWLLPSTITPKYDAMKGLTHFERRVNGEAQQLEVADIVYVWAPKLDGEIGPGKGWVSGILTESGIATYMNKFASEFFQRGAMPGTLLSVEGNPSRDELDRLEQWWRRMLQGVKRAWETVAVKATVKPVVIGYPTKDLAMPQLLQAVRQQICVAAGVPQTMLEDAANFATASEHHQAFYSETVVPSATIIQATLNRQIFEPAGLRMVLDWQSLDIFQEDEAERAAALAQMTTAGVPLDLAMEMLGMELPNEMTYDDLRKRLEEDKEKGRAQALEIAGAQRPSEGEQPPSAEQRGQREELRRWQRKALKALREGKGAAVDFDTDVLGLEDQATIRERLSAATSEEEVKGAFTPPFCGTARDQGSAYP
jgi:HK97 family phage portal protein